MGGAKAAGSHPRLGIVALVLAGSVALSRVLGVAREMVLSRVLGNSAVAMGAVMTGGSVVAMAVLLIAVRPWTLGNLED